MSMAIRSEEKDENIGDNTVRKDENIGDNSREKDDKTHGSTANIRELMDNIYGPGGFYPWIL